MYEEICIDQGIVEVGDRFRIIEPSSQSLNHMIGEIVTVTRTFDNQMGEIFYEFYYNERRFNWYDWRFERV